ncbi:MAG: hypothetical protein Q9179_003193 [Wetmoreana sp. 5 TL-2023]
MVAANEDSRKAREATIAAKLKNISKQRNITQDSKTPQVLAHYAVDELQQQKTKLDERRGARPYLAKWSITLQKFISTTAEWMKAYSGLNDVAKGVDNQYGGLVTDKCPMTEKALTIVPARFWQAIRRPPKLGIDLKAAEIKKAIFEVVSEGNALLVKDYAAQKKIWQEDRAQQRKDQIAYMTRELGISQELADPDRMIAQCKRLHANAFEKAVRRKGTKQLQQISLGLLKDLYLYKPSEETTESSALVLSGSNYDLYETGRYLCWLSPVTTEIAELYQSRQESGSTSKVLFHSPCRDEASRFGTRKEPFNVCLSRFIIQILLWDDKYFSQNRQKIEDDIRHGNLQRIKTLQTLLEGWHGSDEVCVIIDRLDGIAPLDGDSDTDEDEVSGLLEAILEVVSAASCKIRLIVTVDASGWPQVRKDADLEGRWNIWKRRINLQRYSPLFKIDWQQPEIHDG